MRILAELIGALVLIGAVFLGVSMVIDYVKAHRAQKATTQENDNGKTADKSP